LDLFSNSIGENGAKYLGEEISKYVPLTFLNLKLRRNRIGHNGKRLLKKLVIKAKTLIQYYIQSN